MIRHLAAAAAVLITAAAVPASPAAAFNCAIPGIFSAAKKTVCANPTLTALDQAEEDDLVALRSRLGSEAMVPVSRDRRIFLSQRDRCGRDVRCHEATYTAQTRLYRRLGECETHGARKLFCVSRTLIKHREALHRSM